MYKVSMQCRGIGASQVQGLEQRLRHNLGNNPYITTALQTIDLRDEIEVIHEQLGPGYFEPWVTITYDIIVPQPHLPHHSTLISILDQALTAAGESAIRAFVQEIVDHSVLGARGGLFAGYALGKFASGQLSDETSTDNGSVFWSIVKEVAIETTSSLIAQELGRFIGSCIERKTIIIMYEKDPNGNWIQRR